MKSLLTTFITALALVAGLALSSMATGNTISFATAALAAPKTRADRIPATRPGQTKTCKSIGFPPNGKSTLPADFPAPPTRVFSCGQHSNENIFLNSNGWDFDEILFHYLDELKAQGYRVVKEGRTLRFTNPSGTRRGRIWSATATDPPIGYRITFNRAGR